jgi:hypothetical protein
MFFGDVHVRATRTAPKNIVQKYIKMNNKENTEKHNTEINKDEQHGQHQKT